MDKSTKNKLITVNSTVLPASMLLVFLLQNAAWAAAAVLGPVYAASVVAADVILTRSSTDNARILRRVGCHSEFRAESEEIARLYEDIKSRGAMLVNCGVPFFGNFYNEIMASAENLINDTADIIKGSREKDSVNMMYLDGKAGEMELLAERADILAVAYMDYLKNPDTNLNELNLKIRDNLAAYRANRENDEAFSDDEIRKSIWRALAAGNFSRVERLVNDYHSSFGSDLDSSAFEMAITENIPGYVSLHSGEFKLDPGDGTQSPYLRLCGNSEMTDLLISLGAPRGEAGYKDSSFAFHSNTGVVFVLKEEFLIAAYNRLNGLVKTNHEVFLNFFRNKYYPENTVVKILDMLNINSINRKNLYEDLCKKLARLNRRSRNKVVHAEIPDIYRAKITDNGWDLLYIFESIGYHCEYEGTDDPFKGPGVCYIS